MHPLSRAAVRAAMAVIPAALISLAPHAALAQRGPTQRIMFRSDVPQAEHRVAATAAQLASAVKQVYAQLGIPLTQSSEDPNDLFTPYMRVRGKIFEYLPSTFLQCQDALTGNIADTGELTLAILHQMHPSNDGTTLLRMQVDATVRRRDTSSDRVPCSTTGKLEQAVFALVEQQLFPDPPAVAADSAAAARP